MNDSAVTERLGDNVPDLPLNSRPLRSRPLVLLLVLGVTAYVGFFRESTLDKVLTQVPRLPTPPGMEVVAQGTDTVYVNGQAVRGAYTVVYFSSETCRACAALDPHLKQLVGVRPDVAVRKIDMGGDWSVHGARERYNMNIRKTPFIVIYDPAGKIIAADEGAESNAYHLLYQWINRELHADGTRRRSS